MSAYVGPVLMIVAGMVLMSNNTTSPDAYQAARHVALQFIRRLKTRATIVFDFDETLFHPHTILDTEFTGERKFWYSDRRPVHIYKPIREIIDVLQVASSLGHRIIIITARPDTPHTKATIDANFRKRGMRYHQLYMSTNDDRDFKAHLRNRIDKSEWVALTIGDQWGDVRQPGRAHWIKLPDTHDRGLHTSLPQR